MERFAREQAPERAERTDTLVWGKNAVTELLKSGGAVDTVYLTDTMPQAVAKLQPRRVILTFGTNDLNPGYKAADFVKNYQTGIEAIVTAYPSVDIIVNAIPPIGQQHFREARGCRLARFLYKRRAITLPTIQVIYLHRFARIPDDPLQLALEVPEQRRGAEGFRHRLRQERLCGDERRHPSDPHGDGRAVQLHPHPQLHYRG